MKMNPILLALLLATPMPVQAFRIITVAHPASGGEAPSCDTVQQMEWGTPTGDADVGRVSITMFIATKFVATGTYTVCAADLMLSAVGSPTQSLTAAIYSHDAAEDDPDAIIVKASSPVDASTISGENQTVKFENISADITDGSTNWVVLTVDSYDASNYVDWEWWSSSPIERAVRDDDGVGTWGSLSTSRAMMYKLYGD